VTTTDAAAASTRRGGRALALVAAVLVALVAAAHLWVNPDNPPGFHQDEAAIATNALALAQTGRDQYGAWTPLFFRSFDDYKSPEFVYLLAGAFRVTGPSQTVARGLGAVLVLASVAALALLARRLSGSNRVAVAAFVLAGTTPWLYEIGRLALEVTVEPLLLVVLLLLVERCLREERWTTGQGVLVGLALAAIAYSYAAGRLYAPLLALCLPLASGLRRMRFVAAAWVAFGVALLPILVYALRHPGAMSKRLHDTSFVQEGMSRVDVVRQAVENYVGYFDLPHWVLDGDGIVAFHVPGAGSLPLVVALLAAAGVVLLVARSGLDGFWRFTLAATLLGPVPAALTDTAFHSLRSLPLVVGLLTLSVPALAELDRGLRGGRRWALPVTAVLAVAWLGWLAQFTRTFEATGPDRRFDRAVPVFLARALASDERVYTAPGDLVAVAHARWYADLHDVPRRRVVDLPAGARPPSGAIVLGTAYDCGFPCRVLDAEGSNWLARAT
jgi:4-amino-4-deoxy-L-arabinose transferase-like glycosyltransferase